jgi:hypothetical protein
MKTILGNNFDLKDVVLLKVLTNTPFLLVILMKANNMATMAMIVNGIG